MADIDKYKNNPMALRAWQEGYNEGVDQCETGSRVTWWVLIAIITTVAMLALSGCDDRYRDPCQDPANTKKPECNPPICDADGTCAEYLIYPRGAK